MFLNKYGRLIVLFIVPILLIYSFILFYINFINPYIILFCLFYHFLHFLYNYVVIESNKIVNYPLFGFIYITFFFISIRNLMHKKVKTRGNQKKLKFIKEIKEFDKLY